MTVSRFGDDLGKQSFNVCHFYSPFNIGYMPIRLSPMIANPCGGQNGINGFAHFSLRGPGQFLNVNSVMKQGD